MSGAECPRCGRRVAKQISPSVRRCSFCGWYLIAAADPQEETPA